MNVQGKVNHSPGFKVIMVIKMLVKIVNAGMNEIIKLHNSKFLVLHSLFKDDKIYSH
jgi:hypothetical protein